MQNIITAENISKCYRLGAKQQNSTLRDAIVSTLKSPFTNSNKKEDSILWALKDVSFEIKRGETVGIIGHNGAGKSTLLKILSRITKPTKGWARLKGRVGSLLEIGTGFHAELTGRENIFLNGAVLGMRREEILKKFDEIVAFAEVEKFLDTPVKFYSSGMYMRLAFAVAAHLEPEILIVDEVLAVGDITFQRKCLNKMKDVGEHGRTVLFVSHNTQAISRLCNRGILLSEGKIIADGAITQVINAYLKSDAGTAALREWKDEKKAPRNEIARLMRARVCDENGNTSDTHDIRNQVCVEMTYQVLTPHKALVPNFHFYNEDGVCVFISHNMEKEWRYTPRPVGQYTSRLFIPGNFLAEGRLLVTVALSTYQPFEVHFVDRDTVSFTVIDNLDGDTARGDYAGHLPGIVRPLLDWKTVKEHD